jgi:hypothetical protein
MNLSPKEIRKTICSHPRLLTVLPPHFTVIELPLSPNQLSWDTWGADEIKNLLRFAFAKLNGRLFIRVIYQGSHLLVGFEEPAEASFFTLMVAGQDFSQQP